MLLPFNLTRVKKLNGPTTGMTCAKIRVVCLPSLPRLALLLLKASGFWPLLLQKAQLDPAL